MSSASSEDVKTIQLKCNDDQIVVVKLDVAKKMSVIQHILELNLDVEKEVPLPNVASAELKKIIEYLEIHLEDTSSPAEYHDSLEKSLNSFDADFIEMDNSRLLEIYLAANYLGCENLKELVSFAIANTIKGKKSSEMSEIWNFENDWSEEEIKKIREEKPWTAD